MGRRGSLEGNLKKRHWAEWNEKYQNSWDTASIVMYPFIVTYKARKGNRRHIDQKGRNRGIGRSHDYLNRKCRVIYI